MRGLYKYLPEAVIAIGVVCGMWLLAWFLRTFVPPVD